MANYKLARSADGTITEFPSWEDFIAYAKTAGLQPDDQIYSPKLERWVRVKTRKELRQYVSLPDDQSFVNEQSSPVETKASVPPSSVHTAVLSPAPSPQVVLETRALQTREWKSSGVAIILSFFWTGLGQLYAGHILRGLAMMLGTPVVWFIGLSGGMASCSGALGTLTARTTRQAEDASAMGEVGLLLALLPLVWWIGGMIDAKNLCERWNKQVAR